MAAPQRRTNPDLKKQLFENFHRFSFFESVHLLEMTHPEKEQLGEGLEPGMEPVRFTVAPSLSFPASDIAALAEEDDGTIRMGVTFLGLIGPNGILPHWYNELALERNRQSDFSLTDFLDLFHHRLITLFYLAWKKHRFSKNYQPGGQDRLSRCLLSLCGLGLPGLGGGRIGFQNEALAFNTGIMAMSFPTAAGIESAVAGLAEVEATVEQFVERMIPLSVSDMTALGTANSRLGMDTVCGGYIWDCQSMFRVSLGPMEYAAFKRFLPGGQTLGPIVSFIRTMVGPEYELELKVILDRTEVPPCRLGGETRLGMDTWLLKPGNQPDQDVSMTISELNA